MRKNKAKSAGHIEAMDANAQVIQEAMNRLRGQANGETLIICERMVGKGDNLWYITRRFNQWWEIVEEFKLAPDSKHSLASAEQWLKQRKGVFVWMQTRASGSSVRVLVWG